MNPSFSWLWTMAWRDSRRNRGRLFLFMASIILGIAALVAIDSFEDNLRRDIDAEAQTLLGADLLIRSNLAFSDSALFILDSLGGKQAEEKTFVSMVYFGEGDSSKFSQIRALEGEYPFYGEIETIPSSAAQSFREGPRALVEQSLMLQFQAQPGDSIQIGKLKFEIAGTLIKVPGQNSLISTASTPVYIPGEYLEGTGLVQKGSRINYSRYFLFENQEIEIDKWVEKEGARLELLRLQYDTVKTRKDRLGTAFANLTRFLNLVGFIALLLGSIGVASAVQVYLRQKKEMIAVLRCLGTTSRQAFFIFLIQISVMGTIGSLLGAALGVALQYVLPTVLKDFLPVAIEIELSWTAIGQGILAGIAISLLFAMLPLLEVRRVSPLQAIRSAFEKAGIGSDPLQWLVYVGIGLFLFGFSWLKIGSPLEALFFTIGLLGAFGLLVLMGLLVIFLARKTIPAIRSYTIRQGISNLFRPQNQTLVLIVTIGLGALLITLLFSIQSILLNQINIEENDTTPNLILFDVQPQERFEVSRLIESEGLPVLQMTPLVTIKLESFQGKDRSEWLADTALDISRWVLNWEFRVTYRDTLLSSEEIVDGEWQPRVEAGGSIFISLEEDFARNELHASIGDEIIWDIQGLRIKTIVGSFRRIDYSQLQNPFIVLFPAGVMEEAPQFYILSTRTEDDNQKASFQGKLAKRYPAVSVIDLKYFLETANEVLGKVTFVIRFMAFFSILTGILVLIGSMILSRFQRVRESVLLRTIGASRSQLWQIFMIEYLALGTLGALAGIILGIVGSILLAVFAFRATPTLEFLPFLIIWLSLAGLTLIIGILNSRQIVRKPPLEILREEV